MHLVERDRGAEEGVDDVGVVVELLVDHEGKDTHLGSTAVVQLDGELLVDGLLVPAGSLELSSLDVILSGGISELDETDEGDDLGNTSGGDGLKGGKAVLDGGERNAVGDLTRKSDTSGGHNVSEDGKLGDAAVLGLDGAEAVEASLVSLLQQSKRIPESKRSLSADGILEGHLESGGSGSHAGRREGSDGHKGGNDGNESEHLHKGNYCDMKS